MFTRIIILAGLVLCLAGQANAAMKNEPREFKGIPFGREYQPDKSFSCQTDSEEGVRCTRSGDDLVLYGVPLKSLTYLFMYKRLFTADMEVEGQENYDKLAAEMTKRHGKPEKLQSGMLSYTGSQVDILIYFDATRGVGEFSYVFKNLPCPVE
jgi:hypothetical protein